eukprot:g11408.t1
MLRQRLAANHESAKRRAERAAAFSNRRTGSDGDDDDDGDVLNADYTGDNDDEEEVDFLPQTLCRAAVDALVQEDLESFVKAGFSATYYGQPFRRGLSSAQRKKRGGRCNGRDTCLLGTDCATATA